MGMTVSYFIAPLPTSFGTTNLVPKEEEEDQHEYHHADSSYPSPVAMIRGTRVHQHGS